MTPHEEDMIDRAQAFATNAHASIDQRRKYTNEPYILHPIAVAKMVRSIKCTADVIAAAYLHDVVEDTPVTLQQIWAEFGPDVASLVDQVTDVSRPADGNREARKALDRMHLAKASHAGATIKLADLIDNTRSIIQHDRKFAVTYMREKKLILQAMTQGSPLLRSAALSIVHAWEAGNPMI